jgi:hypothetical protein
LFRIDLLKLTLNFKDDQMKLQLIISTTMLTASLGIYANTATDGARSALNTAINGGSVTDGNATELSELTDVDGFLVGGASLDVDKFYAIYNQL